MKKFLLMLLTLLILLFAAGINDNDSVNSVGDIETAGQPSIKSMK